MIEETLKYLIEDLKIKSSDKLLLAISGGIDSIVMLDIFSQLPFEVTVAHCNFQLRGKESDGDELFVKNVTEKLSIPFHTIRFETQHYAESNNLSIQMAARALRYDWFEKLRVKLQYDYIAIAHNANDVVETFFINLSRGTGINGLSGIKAKTGSIIRPLLPFSRLEIESYSTKNDINFREDASNASDKYHRNRIRHHIIPEFLKINPSFLSTMLENIDRLNDASVFLKGELEKKKNKLITENENSIRIPIKQLQEEQTDTFVLYELIREYGFNSSQIKDILNSINNQPGQIFLSSTYKLVKDREALIISKLKQATVNSFEIFEGINQTLEPISLKLEILEKQVDFKPNRDENIAEFDADKIAFPLYVKRWEAGDYFYPLGMKNKKKLSDFFVDRKFSIIDKENIWLLTSKTEIIWIIGHRMDNRYKVTKSTSRILKIAHSY